MAQSLLGLLLAWAALLHWSEAVEVYKCGQSEWHCVDADYVKGVFQVDVPSRPCVCPPWPPRLPGLASGLSLLLVPPHARRGEDPTQTHTPHWKKSDHPVLATAA